MGEWMEASAAPWHFSSILSASHLLGTWNEVMAREDVRMPHFSWLGPPAPLGKLLTQRGISSIRNSFTWEDPFPEGGNNYPGHEWRHEEWMASRL